MENGKMYCKHCGEIIDADSIICPKCGKQVREIKKAQPKVITNNSSTSSSATSTSGKTTHKKALPPDNNKPLIIILIIFIVINIIRPPVFGEAIDIDTFNFMIAILFTYFTFKCCPRTMYKIKVKLLKTLTQKDDIKKIDNKSKKVTDIIMKLSVFVISLIFTLTIGSIFTGIFGTTDSIQEDESKYETSVENSYQKDEVDIDSVMSDIDSATKGNNQAYKETYQELPQAQELQKDYDLSQFELHEVGEMNEILKSNALQAKNQFERKYVAVIGKISNIDASGSYIDIDPVTDDFTFLEDIQCYTHKNQDIINKISQLSKEQVVIVYGQISGVGEILGYSMDIIDIEVLTDEQVASLSFSSDGSITTEAEDDGMTMGQRNAVKEAQSYINYSAFSREGLIDQLSSEYGSNYPYEDAVFAVDYLEKTNQVDWYEQAVKEAQSYLEYSAFSREELIDQLSSEYGSQFTPDQAEYAVNIVYQ